jgi:hypothetical protein
VFDGKGVNCGDGEGVVVRRERKEEERKGSLRSLCVLLGEPSSDDWPENMRGVEVGWARKGMAWWDDGGAGAGRVRTLLPAKKSLSVPASEAPTMCFDWAGSLFRPVCAPHIVVSCHISPDQTSPTQSLANNASDIVCLAAGRLRAVR